MKVKNIFILLLCFVVTIHVNAQRKPVAPKPAAKDTVIKDATIEIIQSYKPEVQIGSKPKFTATLPATDTNRPNYNYEVPQQTLYYTYNSLPLRPLALGKDTTQLPSPNYLKVGGGNLSTFYVDAGIGGFKGDNYETALHVHYLSQVGNIANQSTSSIGAEGKLTYLTEKYTWHSNIDVERNGYHFYGYNHDVHKYSSDAVQQIYTGVRASVDMLNNNNETSFGINYHPAISASVYTDKLGASEKGIKLNLPFAKNINNKLQVLFGLNAAFVELNTNTINTPNNYFQIVPGIQYKSTSFDAHLFINPTMGVDASYLLPDMYFVKKISKDIAVDGGFQALFRQNTYEDLSTRNPYIFNAYTLHQTITKEAFIGVKKKTGEHLSISLRVSYWQYNNLPEFIDTLGDRKQFNIIYDHKVEAFSLQAGISYQIGNSMSLGISGAAYNFYNTTLSDIYEEPSLRIKADFSMRIPPQVMVTGYAVLLNGINTLDVGNTDKNIGAVFDIGGSGEYSFAPRLSLFLNINNLVNNKYERWQGYAAYGFNVYGGIRFKF